MKKAEILNQIKGGLIVSCQALPEEPLHSSFIMGRMAYAAMLGGAKGIRANSVEDILEMRKLVNLPIIGIIKHDCDDSPVRITPTMAEVDALADIGVDIIATDATDRLRTGGVTLDAFFQEARSKYPNQLFMADCSTYEEALHAQEIGFDIAEGISIPDFSLLKKMADTLKIPVIAEGGIWSPEQLKQALLCGVHAAVVGTAITRPMDITKRYVAAITE